MDVTQTVAWLQHYADVIAENKTYLTELDAAIGDGDHGANMARGWQAAKEALDTFEGDIGQCFMLVSKTLIAKVGGASGPLYGTVFLRMGIACKGKQSIAREDWPGLLKAACEGIQQRGKVTGGEKTMFDVWKPLLDAVEASDASDAADDVSLAQLMRETAEARAEETKNLRATKGRAAYVGERSVGHSDPGAVSTSLLFKSLHETLR